MGVIGELLPPVRERAALVYSPHPLLPDAGRVVRSEVPLPGETLACYLVRNGVDVTRPIIVAVNGDVIPRDWLHRVRPKVGTLVTVRGALAGGDESNPLAIVAMIALMVAAPYLGTALAGSVMGGSVAATTFIAGTTITGAMIGTAVVTMAGAMLVNKLFAPPRPDLGRGLSSAKASPTYSISGGQNRARPYEPLSLTLGTHRVFFDLAGKPYTVFDGEDQYLYQIFLVGLVGPHGALDVTDLRIGDTPLSAYDEVTIESSVGSVPALAPANVDTAAGGAVTSAGGDVLRTTSAGTTRIEVDLQASVFRVGNSGYVSATLEYRAEYRVAGSSDAWQTLVYDRQANYYTHYWSQGYYAQEWQQNPVDGLPSYFVDVWQQTAFDSDRSPAAHTDGVGGWRWLPYSEKSAQWPAPDSGLVTWVSAPSFVSSSATPIRRTYGKDVPSGQYEVRLQKITADSTDTRLTLDLSWNALKSYQADDGYYEGQQFLSMRIKASGQLNGAIDRLSGVVKQPTAAGEYSNNPADLFVFFAIGHKSAAGRPLWGGQRLLADIDTAAIAAWRAFCTEKGLSCNLQLDTQRSVWDVLQAIARCGRASPTWASGKLGVVWDAPSQPVVANFGMANIVRGSFRVQYQSEAPVDEVVLNYIDADNGYAADHVRSAAPGVTTPLKSAMLELWGCTSRAMAVHECNLAMAENIYRTRTISWDTDMEGMVVTRGDVVSLSHDLTQWGQSGRLLAGTTTTVTLDREIQTDAGGTWVGITDPEGTQTICRVQHNTSPSAVLVLLDPLPSAPDADNPVDWRYCADYLATPGKLVKIVGIKPSGPRAVTITAVDEDDAYYAAEGGVYTPPDRREWLSDAPIIRSLGVTEQQVVSGGSTMTKLLVTWAESGAVDSRRVRYAIDGGALQVAGFSDGSRYELIVGDVGTVLVEVTLYDGAGQTSSAAQATLSHTLAGVAYAPLSLESLAAAGELFQIRLSWGFDGDVNGVKHVAVYGAQVNSRGAATLLTTIAAPTAGWLHTGLPPGATWYYWARVVDAKGRESDWFPLGATAGVSATSVDDPSDIIAALVGSISEDELTTDLSTRINQIDAPTTGALAQITALQSQVDSIQSDVADLSGTPDYDNATTYAIDDIVKYSGGLYRAIAATTGNLPTNTSYWQKIGDYASIGDAVAGLSVAVDDLDTRVTATEGGLTSEIAARQTLATQVRGSYTGSDITMLSSGLLWSERQARSTADASEVTARQALAATLTGFSDPSGKVLADLTSGIVFEEKAARVSAVGAVASSVATVETTVDGHTATLATQATSINGIQAKYTVKIDNNGYVSGYGLISTANNGTPTSSFTVLADQFKVVTPGKTAKVPFVVGTVNGVSAVGIDGTLVVDGSITAPKIDTRELTVKDAAGTVILGAGTPLAFSNVAGAADLGNLIPDVNFDDSAWFIPAEFSVMDPPAPGLPGMRSLQYQDATVTPTGTYISGVSSPGALTAPVTPGEKIYWSYWIKTAATANGTASFYVRCYDSADVVTEIVESCPVPQASAAYRSGSIVVPAGTVRIGFRVRRGASSDGATTSGWVQWSQIRISRTQDGATVGADVGTDLRRAGVPVAEADLVASWNKISTSNAATFFNSSGLPGTYIQNLQANKILAGALGVSQWISSVGYSAGSAGWAINANGSAEFRNITARGDIEASTLKVDAANIVKNLNIEGYAVTVPVGGTNTVNVGAGAGSLFELPSADFKGAPTYVEASVELSWSNGSTSICSGTITITRNGSDLRSYYIGDYCIGTVNTTFTVGHFDSSTAPGARVYGVRINAIGATSITATRRTITAIGLRNTGS